MVHLHCLQFTFCFQAVNGCRHLLNTDLSHHQFAILVHDVISVFFFAIGIVGI